MTQELDIQLPVPATAQQAPAWRWNGEVVNCCSVHAMSMAHAVLSCLVGQHHILSQVQGDLLKPQEFEVYAGNVTSKKWRHSIRVRGTKHDGMKLGDYLNYVLKVCTTQTESFMRLGLLVAMLSLTVSDSDSEHHEHMYDVAFEYYASCSWTLSKARSASMYRSRSSRLAQSLGPIKRPSQQQTL